MVQKGHIYSFNKSVTFNNTPGPSGILGGFF